MSHTHLSRLQAVPLPPAIGARDTPTAMGVAEHLKAGMAFHSSLQQPDGHFPGDYGGPMFLMPGLIIACYVSGVMDSVLPPPFRTEMIRYLRNHQNEDGGYGLHIEGGSTMFGSGLRCASRRARVSEWGKESPPVSVGPSCRQHCELKCLVQSVQLRRDAVAWRLPRRPLRDAHTLLGALPLLSPSLHQFCLTGTAEACLPL